jgi:GTP-binding protein
MPLFSQAQFVASAGKPGDFPPARVPELVFAGRSNVGKSSAINALTGRKRLAFTSKTPGRTQTINFYSLGDDARLVDLPGYGFARVPHAVRAQWRELVGAYLSAAANLVGVVVVMDCRHPLTPLDAQLLGWLPQVPLLALLSKSDKLPRTAQAAAARHVTAAIAGTRPEARVQLFSSLSRHGVDETRDLLEAWVQAAQK